MADDSLPRLETGPLQDGDDWPGIFIRGDNALMGYAPALRRVLEQVDQSSEEFMDVYSLAQTKGLLKLLESAAKRPDQQVQLIERKK